MGASLGEAFMSQPAAANSPAILAAALAVVSAALGWFAQGPLRVGVSLALFTFVSVLLCQVRVCYVSCVVCVLVYVAPCQ